MKKRLSILNLNAVPHLAPRILVLILAALLIPSISCKRALNIEPRQDIPTPTALSTANDLEAAVNGAVQGLQATGALGGAMKLIPDIMSDICQVTDVAYQRGVLVYFGVYQRNTFAAADNVWAAGYAAIERANNVIRTVTNNSVSNPQELAYLNNKDRLLGEALFVRAIMHFELCRLYGLQFGLNTDGKDGGVVLKTAPSETRQGQARATVGEVYSQVEADLLQATKLLPVDYIPSLHPRSYGGRVGGRIIKDAAHALLARVYFQTATQAGYDSALAHINLVIGSTPGMPEHYQPDQDHIENGGVNYFFKRGNEAAVQTIFQIVNNYNRYTNEVSSTVGTFLAAYAGSQFSPTSPLLGTPPAYVASEEFSQLHAPLLPSVIGQRANLYSNKPSSTQYYVDKYVRVEGQPPVLNLPVIRAAELILTRAEINATRNNLPEALADLNYIHSIANAYRNGGPLINPAGYQLSDQATLLRNIRTERIVELAFEGDRLHDIRRRNQAEINFGLPDVEPDNIAPGGYRAGNPPSRRNDFRVYTSLPYNSPNLLLILPDAEIYSNPLAKR